MQPPGLEHAIMMLLEAVLNGRKWKSVKGRWARRESEKGECFCAGEWKNS